MSTQKSSSSSSTPRPPRSPGVTRYGRTGGESADFHSGPIAAKATRATVLRARRNIHRINHCGRCDARLVGGRCPSCGYDPGNDGDLVDDEDGEHGYSDDAGLLGDDLNRRGRLH